MTPYLRSYELDLKMQIDSINWIDSTQRDFARNTLAKISDDEFVRKTWLDGERYITPLFWVPRSSYKFYDYNELFAANYLPGIVCWEIFAIKCLLWNVGKLPLEMSVGKWSLGNACSEMLIGECLLGNTFWEMLIGECLLGNTFWEMLIGKCLLVNARFKMGGKWS